MGKKRDAGFYEKCQDAIEKLERDKGLEWHAGSDFDTFARLSIFGDVGICNASNYWFDGPTSMFGIKIIYDDKAIAPNIIELRAEDGSVVTLEIPDLRRG